MSIKTAITDNKKVKIALHVAFWLVVFSLPLLLHPALQRRRGESAPPPSNTLDLFYIGKALVWIAFFYLNTHILIPRLFYTKKFILFILSHIGTLLILMTFEWMHFKLVPRHMGFHPRGFIFFNFFPYLFFVAGSVTLRMFLDRVAIEKAAKEKETENLKTELSFLRSQISPHFMFNVLNNMVALARKKSDLLEPSLIKLSSIMRYMIYENDEEKVLLEKEIEYLQSYIDLQQQRFGKSITVKTSLGPIDGTYFIEPMLLIPFVENAFKHGTGMVENGCIEIELNAVNGALLFTVKNRFDSQRQLVKDKTSGIGLENVKRRLDLLYVHKHKLEVNKDGEFFYISLSLKFN